ncbi:MAG: LCP family protein [Armatimonadota bacterium]
MRAQPARKRYRRKRSCLGCLGRLLLLSLLFIVLLIGGGLVWYYASPPFRGQKVAKVLLVGLDEPPKFRRAGPRRSDTIMLCAVRTDRSGATLISVPRDARVRLPHRRYSNKINAAYAIGKVALLKETLADPDVLGADLPYHLVMDSRTVREVVDAVGGVTVNVPVDMNYDDNWGDLHIHLKAGKQRLSGEQAVGYLRWRKNKNGGGSSDDFKRADRQRYLLAAIVQQARTPLGLIRMPATYRAFRKYTYTNLTSRQLIALALAFRNIRSEAVPGYTTRGGSYVECDWYAGRQLWQSALQ